MRFKLPLRGWALAVLLAAAPAPPALAGGAAETVIDRYRAQIPQLMAEQDIPGLAVAVVDRDRTLWVQGFGHVDDEGSAPVGADTIFSIQSISKLFTATAVMQAAEAGKVDLDEPITTYLPEFTVHSAFEQHPERKITLRMLLGHTAGFTHEAPVGNNNDLALADFDAHIRSISETWLRFPVGSGQAYSNLGIDLAGYILERVEGKPFEQVMRDSLLRPIGMDDSTFDLAEIRARADRATGHMDPYRDVPVNVPMVAAGGLYTSAADLARFLHFQLNRGSIDGRSVLGPRWLHEMQTVPPPNAGAPAGYALGVARHRWNPWAQAPNLFEHGGGGFGFIADLWWLPQVGIGAAILTNSDDHEVEPGLLLSILTDLVTEPGPYRDRLEALPTRPGASDADTVFVPPADMTKLVAEAAMMPRGDEATRWATYAGDYRPRLWGLVAPNGRPARFSVEGGVAYFEAEDPWTEAFVRHRLAEVEPGLFLADDGEMLDLRGQVATWRNVETLRVSGPALWQWVIVGAAALVSFAWLVAALGRTLRPGLRSWPRGRTWRRRVSAVIATATALVTLATIFALVSVPGVVHSGFLGGFDLSALERLVVHLPLAVTVLGATLAAVAVSGRRGRWWSRAVTMQYAALAVAVVALVPLLAGWDLIGWGM